MTVIGSPPSGLMNSRSIAKTHWSVSQTCFVAAAVSSEQMADTSSNSNSPYRHCVRLTKDHTPYDSVLKLSNVKRIGVPPPAGRVGLPESAPAKAVGVDSGARFLNAHPTTNPIVDLISIGCSVTQSDLIQRHRKIRSGLAKVGYRGEVLSFDWPARGNAASYLEGRAVNLRSAGNAPAQAEKSGSENVEIETPNLL
jgi:hypothetical protein